MHFNDITNLEIVLSLQYLYVLYGLCIALRNSERLSLK